MSGNGVAEAILEDIIFEIQRNSSECRWFVDSARLSDLLQIPKEEYYRKLYSFRTSKPHRETRNGFSEIDGDFLAEFLQYCLGIGGIQERFLLAGIYFDETSLYELRESFKSLVADSLLRHRLDRDTLLLLATASQNYDDAVDSYLSEKFDIEFFVARTVQKFVSTRNINLDGGADVFLKNYLLALIPTKILNLRDITREFRDRSHYELFGTYRTDSSRKKQRKSYQDQEYRELLEYFGLEDGFRREDLKREFKNLLKKFHPDVNKNGLRKTQEIIAKYNALILRINQNSSINPHS